MVPSASPSQVRVSQFSHRGSTGVFDALLCDLWACVGIPSSSHRDRHYCRQFPFDVGPYAMGPVWVTFSDERRSISKLSVRQILVEYLYVICNFLQHVFVEYLYVTCNFPWGNIPYGMSSLCAC